MVYEEIDPDGDLLIVLTPTTAPFAVDEAAQHDDDDTGSEAPFDQSEGILVPSSDRPHPIDTQPRDSKSPEAEELRFRVSSKYMSFACPGFKSMLTSPWAESLVHQDGLKHVKMENFDGKAFRIVLYVIHSIGVKVPKSLGLDMLVKIAVIVDYLNCAGTFNFHAASWHALPFKYIQQMMKRNDNLGMPLPILPQRRMTLLVFTTSVFKDEGLFNDATRLAILHSHESLPNLGLPIRQKIIDRIEKERQERIGDALAAMWHNLDKLRSHYPNCHPGCALATDPPFQILGADLQPHELEHPVLSNPFHHSYHEVMDAIEGLEVLDRRYRIWPIVRWKYVWPCKEEPRTLQGWSTDPLALKLHGLSLEELSAKSARKR